MKSYGLVATAVAALVLAAPLARSAPAEGPGRVFGFVEDSQGAPLSGVLISVFGRGARGGVVTISDNAGRFALPPLPAGAYTLRALAVGDLAAPPQRITVLPNQDSTFALSLKSILAEPDEASTPEPARHVRWLVRHKRRSILEARGHEPQDEKDSSPRLEAPEAGRLSTALGWLPDVSGSVEWATPFSTGPDNTDKNKPTSLGAVRLGGRLGETAHWSLGGLVAESDSRSWRMAAEFVVEPGNNHKFEAGAGYGDHLLRPAGAFAHADSMGSTGAAFLTDRIEAGPLTATVGGRYSYISFLEKTNYVAPQLLAQVKIGERTAVHLDAGARTVTPGGDLLALSALSVAPPASLLQVEGSLRAEQVRHLEMGATRTLAPVEVTGFFFVEQTRDPLVNEFQSGHGPSLLRVRNADAASNRGAGLRVSRSFGGVARGSLTYRVGRAQGLEGLAGSGSRFHDVAAHLETVIDSTDTRLSGFYRVNTLGGFREPNSGSSVASRFDLQLSQGLPFLGGVTRADWELLVAFRNLLYEASEAGLLDEIVVKNPPKRVVGGVSVRF